METLLLVGAILVCVQIGFFLLRKPSSPLRARTVIVTGILAVFLLFLAYATLSNAPVLDFIDRCRPNGTGLCMNGQSFEQIQNEVDKDHIRLFLSYVILPVVLWIGLQSSFLMRAWQKDKNAISTNIL
jgi:hypothetical protein